MEESGTPLLFFSWKGQEASSLEVKLWQKQEWLISDVFPCLWCRKPLSLSCLSHAGPHNSSLVSPTMMIHIRPDWFPRTSISLSWLLISQTAEQAAKRGQTILLTWWPLRKDLGWDLHLIIPHCVIPSLLAHLKANESHAICPWAKLTKAENRCWTITD